MRGGVFIRGWLDGSVTSEPLGVVLDGPEGRVVSETSVDHRVDGQEVRHGGREQVPLWGEEKRHGDFSAWRISRSLVPWQLLCSGID